METKAQIYTVIRASDGAEVPLTCTPEQYEQWIASGAYKPVEPAKDKASGKG